MVEAIERNLLRGVKLLNYISDSEYDNTTIAPYYSSIGGHMRHILDVFDCVFEGLGKSEINLINRKRNELYEKYTKDGIVYFEKTIINLNKLEAEDFNRIVKVTDDLGLGIITANYTLAAVLIQAHSHAIHHFASVGYVIFQLGINLPDDDFGFNPTTPRNKVVS